MNSHLAPAGEDPAALGERLRALSAPLDSGDKRKGRVVGGPAKEERDRIIVERSRRGHSIYEIMKAAGTNAPHCWRVIEAARAAGDLPPADPMIDPRVKVAGLGLVAFAECEWERIVAEASRRKYRDPQCLMRAIVLTVAHDDMFSAILGDAP